MILLAISHRCVILPAAVRSQGTLEEQGERPVLDAARAPNADALVHGG